MADEHLKADKTRKDNLSVGARGGTIAFALKVSSTALAFINQIILARFLGASGVGEIVIALTVVKISSQLAKFGMEETMMRFVPLYIDREDSARLKGLIFFSIMFCFLLSCFFVFLIMMFPRFISVEIFQSEKLIQLLPVVAIAISAGGVKDVIAGILKGYKDTPRALIPESLISPLLRIIVFLVLIVNGISLLYAIIAFVAGELSAMLLSVFFLLKKIAPIRSAKKQFENKKVLKVAYTIIFSSVSMLLFTQTDILVLGMLSMTKATVGIYQYAAKLVFLVYFPMYAFGASIPPIFSSAYAEGNHMELERVIRKSTRWILSMSMPIIIVLIIEGKNILRYCYGPEFEAGYPVLIILTVAHLISAGTGLVGLFLQMTGQHKTYMKLNMLFVVLNIFLNVVLIRRFGMLGAATATALCMAMLEVACAGIIYRRFSIFAIPESLKFDIFFVSAISVLYLSILYAEIYMGVHILLLAALAVYLWKSFSYNDIPWRSLVARYKE